MNVLLWILQSLLAAHTLMGAVWKFSTPAQSLPSLAAIPPPAWLGLSIVEIACTIALILPALGVRFAHAPVIAAFVIAAEMVLYCALHFVSSGKEHGQLIYWLIVAAFCLFVAYGRLSLEPHV